MRMKPMAAAVILAATMMQPAHAQTAGDYTFKFVGDCWDCAGQGTATLAVTNYVLGSELNGSNFVSFTYDKSSLIDSYTINSLAGFYGSLNDTSGVYAVFIGGSVSTSSNSMMYLQTYAGGTWATGPYYGAPLDVGNGGTWSLVDQASSGVPEAASWAMMLGGFGMIGATMRRKPARVSFD
ncbi:MAG TPA: PEPxxWA-CTERM sorting domain-containing protein [Sphingomonas sp.]|nr:PEPxxWA-CTERM sorting domain-containing protein [Sphingomonas sp.]HMI19183.1 PEPxxWA-CTERM sorting domain-containing protein [Sphingomonas sp.]